MRQIVKVGLLLVDGPSFLVTRKRGTTSFLIPGGKHENGEDDVQAIIREIREELNCGVDTASLKYIGDFTDAAANEPDSTITVKLYSGAIKGSPVASSEIEELRWFDPRVDDPGCLAPSIRNKILPFLQSNHYV
jgi:8-oxo-dGTP diphosphatase